MADTVPDEIKAKWPRPSYVKLIRGDVVEYAGPNAEKLRDYGSAFPAPIYRVTTHG